MSSAALVLGLLLSAQETADGSVRWYSVTQNGEKVGWMTLSTGRERRDGEERRTFACRWVQKRSARDGRFGTLEYGVSATAETKAKLRTVWARWDLKNGEAGTAGSLEGTFGTDGIALTITESGERKASAVACPADAIPVLFFGELAAGWPLEVDRKYPLSALSVNPGKVDAFREVEATVVAQDEVTIGSKTYETFQVEFQHGMKIQNTSWITPRGDLIKMALPLPRGTAEITLTDEAGAKAGLEEKKE